MKQQPLFVDAAQVHVIRDGATTRITGARLVDETTLTAAEVKELTAQGIVRPATPGEIGAAEQRTIRVQLPAEPLFLDAIVHVMRGGQVRTVKGGRLVSETDLTPVEVREFHAQHHIRTATPAEAAAAEQRTALAALKTVAPVA